jgi:hypothetical protein
LYNPPNYVSWKTCWKWHIAFQKTRVMHHSLRILFSFWWKSMKFSTMTVLWFGISSPVSSAKPSPYILLTVRLLH